MRVTGRRSLTTQAVTRTLGVTACAVRPVYGVAHDSSDRRRQRPSGGRGGAAGEDGGGTRPSRWSPFWRTSPTCLKLRPWPRGTSPAWSAGRWCGEQDRSCSGSRLAISDRLTTQWKGPATEPAPSTHRHRRCHRQGRHRPLPQDPLRRRLRLPPPHRPAPHPARPRLRHRHLPRGWPATLNGARKAGSLSQLMKATEVLREDDCRQLGGAAHPASLAGSCETPLERRL